jgi:hypothetical protein
MPRGRAGDVDRGEDVRSEGEKRLRLAGLDADARGGVDDDVGLGLADRLLRDHFVCEVALAAFERVDLVSSPTVTQLLNERAPDEARGSGDEDSHRGRVYWRACAFLTAALLAGGCNGKQNPGPQPRPKPLPKLSFRALDAEQQRLVRHYQPVSRALTAYELAYREWRNGRLGAARLAPHARFLAHIVERSLQRVRRDPATGADAGAKALLLAALEARHRALRLPPASSAYRREWNRSVVAARRALTLLQDLRDRARLIPLPEDAIS